MAFAALAFAAALVLPPDVPYDAQIIKEGNAYVIRSADPAKPLYTYDKDAPGKSNCVGQCAAAWPPLLVKAGKPIDKWTVITRPDGAKQWAFGGKPVYTFARDAEGVPTGDGVGGVWHLLPSIPAK
jgi:predicted lipoprotein with Yx(FWY)xxD motif